LFLFILQMSSYGQNTFPSSGNVGIGTTTPAAALSFIDLNLSNSATGITWYNPDPTSFGISRTPGTWAGPNYQQMKVGWSTGIILDPGFQYGVSYVNVVGGGLRVTAGSVLFPTLTADNTQNKVVVCNTTNGTLFLRDASTLGGSGSGWALTGNTAVNPATTFLGTTDNTPVAFRTNNVERMRVDVNGNVLIGKTSQTNTGYVLDVNGNVRANSVVVNTTGADFVFGSDYKLSPLKKLERFINEHHHLPGIAPAEEMQKRGVDLGDNQTRLLAKIEELTLYVIEQQKQIEALQRQNRKIELAKYQGKKTKINGRHIRK